MKSKYYMCEVISSGVNLKSYIDNGIIYDSTEIRICNECKNSDKYQVKGFPPLASLLSCKFVIACRLALKRKHKCKHFKTQWEIYEK